MGVQFNELFKGLRFIRKRLIVLAVVLGVAFTGASFFLGSAYRVSELASIASQVSDRKIPSRLEMGNFNLSLIRLVASPDKFDGQRIQVIGVLSSEFEDNALYFHREDYLNMNTANAIWVEAPQPVLSKFKEFDGKVVSVVGTFSAGKTGHLGLFAGSILVEEMTLSAERVNKNETVRQKDKCSEPSLDGSCPSGSSITAAAGTRSSGRPSWPWLLPTIRHLQPDRITFQSPHPL